MHIRFAAHTLFGQIWPKWLCIWHHLNCTYSCITVIYFSVRNKQVSSCNPSWFQVAMEIGRILISCTVLYLKPTSLSFLRRKEICYGCCTIQLILSSSLIKADQLFNSINWERISMAHNTFICVIRLFSGSFPVDKVRKWDIQS